MMHYVFSTEKNILKLILCSKSQQPIYKNSSLRAKSIYCHM